MAALSLAEWAPLWELLRRYRRSLLFAVGTMLLGVLLQLPLPFAIKILVDRWIHRPALGHLQLLVWGLLAYNAVSVIVALVHAVVIGLVREHVIATVQMTAWEKLIRGPIRFLVGHRSGYLSARLRADARGVHGILAGPFLSIAQNALSFTAGVVCMFLLQPRLALWVLAFLPLFALVVLGFTRTIRDTSEAVQESSALFGGELQETIAASELIKAYGLERRVGDRLRRQVVELANRSLRLDFSGLLMRRILGAMGMLVPVLVLWLAGRDLLAHRISVGTLIGFQAILSMVFGPTQSALGRNTSIQSGLIALRRLRQFTDLEPEAGVSRLQIVSLKDWGIELSRVSFGYERSRPLLSDLCLELEEGQTATILGPSGAGKTTLLRLLLREYSPTAGSIRIGGTEIDALPLEEYRARIAVAFQEHYLLSGTVESNIRCGQPHASRAEVRAAAELVGAAEFIERLPAGYRTEVGAGGLTLSVGQRVRLSLARMALRDARVVLLDEPTAALDPETAAVVIRGLGRYLAGRTALIISHQPDVSVLADRIFVLVHGALVSSAPTSSDRGNGEESDTQIRASLARVSAAV
jgi:ABC-type bacteriocin/lantibiotic exporter with double-glycine peptidase domain